MAKNHKKYVFDFFDEMTAFDGKPQKFSTPKPVDFNELISKIENDDYNRQIIKLFERAGRDYRDLNAWVGVLAFLADVLLREKTGGRPRLHERPSAKVLRRDFASVITNVRSNGTAIVEKMKARYPRRYGGIGTPTILRWINEHNISIKEIKQKTASTRAGETRRLVSLKRNSAKSCS